jgi:hypothetical protein
MHVFPALLCTISNELSDEKASYSPDEPMFHDGHTLDPRQFAPVLSSVAITKYAPKSGSVPVLFMFALPEVMSANGTASELRRRKLRALPDSPVVRPTAQPVSLPVTQLSVRAK